MSDTNLQATPSVPRLIPLQQVCEELDFSRPTFQRYLARHDIRVVEFSRMKRFLAESDYARLIECAGKLVEA